MPRAHTEHERALIRERLLTTGRECFVRHGLQKTTVADLARGAGIGKGSFYQFFDNKEALFMAVQEREEARFKHDLIAELQGARSGRDAVVALLRSVSERLDRHPFLRSLLEPGVVQALSLRVSPEQLAGHQQRDRRFFLELAAEWKQRGWLHAGVAPEAVFDVLAAMFAISLQRDTIGRDTVDRAVSELAEAVADRWCPDPAPIGP